MFAKKAIKGVGEVAAGLGIMVGFFLIAIFGIFFFVKGSAYLAIHAVPTMVHITYPIFGLCLLVLLPLCFFRTTKTFGLTTLYFFTYFFGVLAWLIGFITTYYYLGLGWLIIGLFLAGIGVVPMGMFAAFTHHRVDVGLSLILLLLFAYGFRFFVIWYSEKDETEISGYDSNVIDIDEVEDEFSDSTQALEPIQNNTHPIEHRIPKRRQIQ